MALYRPAYRARMKMSLVIADMIQYLGSVRFLGAFIDSRSALDHGVSHVVYRKLSAPTSRHHLQKDRIAIGSPNLPWRKLILGSGVVSRVKRI